MTSSARAAPLWSSIVLAVLLVGYVEAHPGPSIPMTYCASINTAGTTTSELPFARCAYLDDVDADQMPRQ